MFVCWCLAGGFARLLATVCGLEVGICLGVGTKRCTSVKAPCGRSRLAGEGQRGRGCHVGVGAAQRGLVWMVPGRNYRVGAVLVLYVGGELLVGISRGRG